MKTATETIEQTAAELGLSMTAEFIPWSKSRNAKEKQPSLNWRVTIRKGERDVITTDYSAGCGHCPAYKASVKELGNQNSIMRAEAIKRECETGHRALPIVDSIARSMGMPILPKLADVLHSLTMDSEALDYTFEDWAGNYGYDRSAEATYRACLDTAIKLRAAIGEAGLSKLREACTDY